jgi:hypothetical protein
MDQSQFVTLVTQVVTLFVIAGGLIATFTTTRNNVASMKSDMVDLKFEIKKIADVMIDLARQEERMTAIDNRLQTQRASIDEMRAIVSRVEHSRYLETEGRFNKLMMKLEENNGRD